MDKIMSKDKETNHEGKGNDKIYTIIVNGREKTFDSKIISFEQIVILAFGEYSTNPNTTYTITFFKGGNDNRPEGTIIEGETMKLKDGTIFNVTATDKS